MLYKIYFITIISCLCIPLSLSVDTESDETTVPLLEITTPSNIETSSIDLNLIDTTEKDTIIEITTGYNPILEPSELTTIVEIEPATTIEIEPTTTVGIEPTTTIIQERTTTTERSPLTTTTIRNSAIKHPIINIFIFITIIQIMI